MIYLKIKDEPNKEPIMHRAFINLLGLVIPKANPDFENKISSVNYWLLEFPDKASVPDREVGLDKDGNVIMATPDARNFGFWTDNDLTFEDFKDSFETEEILKEYFEEKWNLF